MSEKIEMDVAGGMDDHDALDRELIAERYLLGQLSSEEREAFEQHYLDCPICLERLELGRRLRDGLAGVAVEEGTKAAVVQRLGLLAALTRLGRGGRATLVAALAVLALLPAGLLLERGRLAELENELVAARAPQGVTALIALSPTRSAGAPPSTRITLPETPGRIVLVLELRDPGFARYRATLRRGSRVVWQGDDLASNVRGEVALSLHSGTLDPGDHVVDLAGLSATGDPSPVASFAFAIAEP